MLCFFFFFSVHLLTPYCFIKVYQMSVKIGSIHTGIVDLASYCNPAPPEIPQKLVEQLGDKGRMVVPVGDRNQTQILKLIVKSGDTIIEEDKSFVRFVPMVE